MTASPERPAAVPEEAGWSPEDNEWILGPRDDVGRLHGLVRYWRPDGTLVCTCEHDAGKAHGVSRRFHETSEVAQLAHFERGELHGVRTWFATDGVTTERMHVPPMSTTVRRAEVDYDRGAAVAFRYYDREGRAVAVDGTPLPTRPPGVPAAALHDKSGDWVAGRWSEQGAPLGVLRRWSPTGILLAEDHHDGAACLAHGYRASDGSLRVRFHVRGGVLDGEAAAWRRDGSQSLRATFGAVTTIDQLERDGAVARRVRSAGTHAAAAPPAALAVPSAQDQLVLDAIGDGDASALEVATVLSAAGLAIAIARGWGGDADRDPVAARLARALVKQVAPPSLADRLRTLELDRAPRVMTATRMARVVGTLAEEPALDAAVLTAAMIEQGGAGTSLALASPTRARRFLASRITSRSLSLAHLGLDTLPAAIGRFPDLQRIDASSNRLSTVPPELGDVYRLATLDLHRNHITSLPRELTWLPALATLHLAHNGLVAVPPTVFELPELAFLGLGDNALAELPDAIGDVAELRQLWLNDNPLRTLPRGLGRLQHLTFLHLGGLDLAEPPPVVAELTSLEHLWIASRSLTRLPPEIVRLPRLRKLMVWYSGLTSIPDELYEATQLTELRIGNNPLPDGTIARLQEALPGCTIY